MTSNTLPLVSVLDTGPYSIHFTYVQEFTIVKYVSLPISLLGIPGIKSLRVSRVISPKGDQTQQWKRFLNCGVEGVTSLRRSSSI